MICPHWRTHASRTVLYVLVSRSDVRNSFQFVKETTNASRYGHKRFREWSAELSSINNYVFLYLIA